MLNIEVLNESRVDWKDGWTWKNRCKGAGQEGALPTPDLT